MTTRLQESIRLPLSLGAWLQLDLSWPEQGTDWAVVAVHGFGSRRGGEKSQALAAACARRGLTFAGFDFRGHGESSGVMLELRPSGLLDDLAAVREYLTNRGIHRLCLYGSSMGGWAAAWFALQHPDWVTACAVVAPALRFPTGFWNRLTEAEREIWRQTGRLRVQNPWIDVEVGYGLAEERDRFPFDRLVAEYRTPLLIFHGLRDEVVSHAVSVSFLEKTAFPEVELHLYRDGNHRLEKYKDEMAEAACAHFVRWSEKESAR